MGLHRRAAGAAEGISRRGLAALEKEEARGPGRDGLEQDEIRLGRDDGLSRAPDASGLSAARRGPFYFAWGCFRDFVSGPCGVPPKSICTASGTRDRWLRADGEFDSNPSRSSAAIPQSHFGAKPKSVSRPPALPMPEICCMSASDSSKSKISMFSESRSSFEVRGIAATPCCTSQRRQICAAVLR